LLAIIITLATAYLQQRVIAYAMKASLER